MEFKNILSSFLAVIMLSGSALIAAEVETLGAKDNELAKFLMANAESMKNFTSVFGSNVAKVERFVDGKTIEYDITVNVGEGDIVRGDATLSIQRQDSGSPVNAEEGGPKYFYISTVHAKVQ